ncbi:hypothetical protein ID852_02505 [Xenorhabdus sp. 42]|uniref:Transposase n=1 Tax=Xenorhabdus szentirmaii TaxID=290112 RepID=A0AAW3YWV0_9GAMM|nr:MULTISPECIES: hypothetical protein [unclassified Xenorhabdus]MBD2802687.1 hypothetical protein [Xenorhabdus sp. M]MBD2804558.1 hypothetical protein [Xenorhabdus sp. ZM]MBD2819588.1 hypothetical protein [Xenorhabdus sp. 42]
MINCKTASDEDLIKELASSSVLITDKGKEFIRIKRNLGMGEYPVAVLVGDLYGLKSTLILLTNINIHFARIESFELYHSQYPITSINSYKCNHDFLLPKLIFNINHQEHIFHNIEEKTLTAFILQLKRIVKNPAIDNKKSRYHNIIKYLPQRLPKLASQHLITQKSLLYIRKIPLKN